MPAKKLSIIIPVYNSAATVTRTLASLGRIAPVHRSGVEIVVANDGSTDESLERIHEARSASAVFTWKVHDRARSGVAAARNAAIASSEGEWLFFLDADDELALDLVPLLADAVDLTCLTFSVCYLRSGRRWRRLRPPRLGPGSWPRVLTAGRPLAVSAIVFRRGCVERPFEEDFRFLEDWLFWMSNPKIFDRVGREAGKTSSLIHLHGGNASADYRTWGAYRARAAERAAALLGERLGRVERNNLYIQMQIGRLQQGLSAQARTLTSLPCNPFLLAKLGVYAAASVLGMCATPYRAGGPKAPVRPGVEEGPPCPDEPSGPTATTGTQPYS